MDSNNTLKNFNLLYLEDDIDTLQTFSSTLKLVVKQLYSATNGIEGLALLKEHPIDIIITDIDMPDMDGIEFTKQVRKHHKTIPIIYISAYSDTNYMLQAIDNNIKKYLIKPVKIDDLIHTLKTTADEIYQDCNLLNFTNGNKIDLSLNCIYDTENNSIHLTNMEMKFITLLSQNKNALLSEEMITYSLWEDSLEYKKDALYTLVTKIRKKLGKEAITNISKVGYKLNLS